MPKPKPKPTRKKNLTKAGKENRKKDSRRISSNEKILREFKFAGEIERIKKDKSLTVAQKDALIEKKVVPLIRKLDRGTAEERQEAYETILKISVPPFKYIDKVLKEHLQEVSAETNMVLGTLITAIKVKRFEHQKRVFGH